MLRQKSVGLERQRKYPGQRRNPHQRQNNDRSQDHAVAQTAASVLMNAHDGSPERAWPRLLIHIWMATPINIRPNNTCAAAAL